jgi:hypothetical protein
MRRSIGLVVAIFLAFAMSLLAASFPANAGGNCQDKLVGNSYECTFTTDGAGGYTACYSFITGGMSTEFDLEYNGEDYYACTCDAVIKGKLVAFNGSSSKFECWGDNEYMVNGQIKGKTLSGQGVDYTGLSFIFSCKGGCT